MSQLTVKEVEAKWDSVVTTLGKAGVFTVPTDMKCLIRKILMVSDSNSCLILTETNPGMGSQSPRGELCGKPLLTIESEE